MLLHEIDSPLIARPASGDLPASRAQDVMRLRANQPSDASNANEAPRLDPSNRNSQSEPPLGNKYESENPGHLNGQTQGAAPATIPGVADFCLTSSFSRDLVMDDLGRDEDKSSALAEAYNVS